MSDFRRNRVKEEESGAKTREEAMPAQNEEQQSAMPAAEYIHDEYDDYSPWE